MKNIIKPNWDNFKAKFNENPQLNFEWFCYLLFCKEFKQDKGIFRYKNQSAIETNPIRVGDEVIAWQAKFYEFTFSKHKREILETLERAKKGYPEISRLIIYTNEEWGQNKKGRKPGGLEEIEERAKELNVKLEWRARSFFDSSFVCTENKIIAKHFFTSDKNIFNLIEEQQEHTENILKQIKTTFNSKNQVFGVNRDKVIDKLKGTESQVIILSGVAGVGKTAIIKIYYEQQKEKIPFYIFKATEFNNLRGLNDFFKNFDFKEFIEAHNNEKEKIIVIDSVEKILDIDNREPFKEFLRVVLENKWKVIFTTRDNYVDVLNTEFSEIYGIPPENINIKNLTDDELIELAEKYKFNLPSDQKLFELIKNPFYLNEYLRYYREDETLDYIGFKNKLWNKIVFQSKPNLEQCFLKIAFERARNGNFFLNPDCESSILTKLSDSGVLGYESTVGYFITHDIYEEWALEKIIEKGFLEKPSIEDFFTKIGDSLPIRRSFRNWLSEKLLLNNEGIKQFIEESINPNIPSYWKDEILISVLLSDYSDTFFEIFRVELLKNNQTLLKKLIFLLRLACKEVDSDFFKQLKKKHLNLFSLEFILTKPKGKGWESLIKFIFNNIDSIGFGNINFILPVLYDWNTKFKRGEIARFASLIALKYYQWIIEKDVYFSRDKTEENLLQTILFGSSEIKEELKEIFEKILRNKWKYNSDPYYDLIKMILIPNLENSSAGREVVKTLPEYVLKLSDLYWTYTPKKDEIYHYSSIEIEEYFGLEESHSDYSPASAFQTPIYWLLRFSPKKTLDFILEFTNRSVKHYVKSGFDDSVKKVKLFFDDGAIKEQYISHCLWNIYRGTSSPRSPYLLQSIHMALEEFFLNMAKKWDSKVLESWLIYLLKNSESASISAVVVSIVLAYPEKTFNVAKILFKTKEFIIQDKTRLATEFNVLAPLGAGLGGEIYQKERIESKNLKHRKCSLEELFLNYQLFRSEEISEEEAKKRQKKRQNELWNILDDYYRQLPDKDKETEKDKTWKLFLARMDRRKMKITTEQRDDDILIQFNPKLEPDLKEFSEKSLEKISKSWKYTPLKVWASYKMKNDEKYKEYKKYEDNPKQALIEAKEIIKETRENKLQEFYLSINYSIPAEVCSVLIKYHIDDLSEKEKVFCGDIILEAASFSLRPGYQYQISDGVESAISVLPILFKKFPEKRETIKIILLLTLFDPHHIGMYAEFADFPTRAINELFTICFEDAQTILFGYLKLKPEYEALRKKTQQENYAKGIYQVSEYELLEAFKKQYEKELEEVVNNQITCEELGEIENLDLYVLKRAFQLIPEKTNNEIHKEIAKTIINAFAPKILSDDRENKIDYEVKDEFLQKYAYFVLNSPQNEIYDYLKPFIDNFNAFETIANLFEKFIYAENILNTYDKFWLVWDSFKEKVFEICEEGKEYWYVDKIIKSYLFATVFWKENTKEWHTIKDNNKKFFEEVSQKIGNCPSTLYALSKFLNGIGSQYINDGIIWISNILKNNNLASKKLETNTIYYIENLIWRYIYNNREQIKKRKESKEMVLRILNFLIEKGSVVGYMIREDIL